LPDGARFCPACGTVVDDARASAPLIAKESATNGPSVERRHVSVLFVDLVGFTELAGRLDPEEVREFQTAYFDRAREIVGRYGGTVEKFIGDAVMAVWGAPVSNEDDAERAVRAGLDLMAAVPQLQAAAPLEARAGVASGEAAVTIGADGQGMVSGDTVNLAARLQAAAEPGTAVTDEATRRASEASIVYQSAGKQQLKGFADAVELWRADRVVSGRGGSGRTGELEAPFVGRTGEITLLKDLFHSTARERRLRVVSITGQAGIGKSRLAWEFEKYIDGITGDVYWHQGRSPAYGEAITFWALGEMVRRRAGIAEGEDHDATSRKVREMLGVFIADDRERARIEPAIRALLGLEGESPTERGELFGAWRTLFERIGAQGPVVLVFEDLQWSDGGLIDFIGHLLEWSRQQPIFIVTLARPELLERFPTWGAGQRNFTSMHLEPLPNDDMRALLAGLAPGLPARTVKAILARAEGVPLYAVETVRMLVSDGLLVREGDAYRTGGAVERVSIPASLHALVAARIDGLAPADRAILQQAAVLGSSFSVGALASISGQSEESLAVSLGRLSAREFVRLETDPRSPERGQYQFVQSVIREVAYQTLTKRDRRARHLAAARYFESLGDEELASALASHYLDAWRSSGEGPEADAMAAQARVALRGAADRAGTLHSYDQQASLLKLALEVATDDRERAVLLEKAGGAANGAARLDEAQELLERAIEIHRRLGDTIGEGRAIEPLGFLLITTGRLDEAITLLEPAVEKVRGVEGAADVHAMLVGQLARAHYLRGEHELAIELADSAIAEAERHDVISVIVDALVTKGSAIGSRRPRESWAILFGAIQLADRYGIQRAGQRARNNLAVMIESEDPATSFALLQEAVDMSRRLGLRDAVQWFTTQIVFGLLERGRTEEAKALLAEYPIDEVPEFIAFFLLGSTSWLVVLEGRFDEFPALDAEIERIASTLSNAEYAGLRFFNRAFAAEVQRDYATAAENLGAVISSIASAGPGPHSWRGRMLVRDGRFVEARAELEAVRATSERGTRVDMERTYLEAVLAAAERSPEAAALFGEVIKQAREMELEQVVLLAAYDFASLVGLQDSGARAAAEEALETAGRHGWKGIVALFEPLFAGVADVPASPAPSETPADVIRAGGTLP
jgi:class 3 adenylate cyclase/tetratricopeptide (TPR) repeat protein